MILNLAFIGVIYKQHTHVTLVIVSLMILCTIEISINLHKNLCISIYLLTVFTDFFTLQWSKWLQSLAFHNLALTFVVMGLNPVHGNIQDLLRCSSDITSGPITSNLNF